MGAAGTYGSGVQTHPPGPLTQAWDGSLKWSGCEQGAKVLNYKKVKNSKFETGPPGHYKGQYRTLEHISFNSLLA